MRGVLLEVLRGELGPLEGRRRLLDLPGVFEGKTPAAETRERAACVVDLGLQLLRDTERVLAGIDRAELEHGEHIGPLLAIPQHHRRKALQTLLTVRADVALNLGAETLLDRALGALAEPFTSPPTKVLVGKKT